MTNKIQNENAQPGTDQWKLSNPVPYSQRDPNNFSTAAIEGYASLTSVNIGSDIGFYVRTKAPSFSIDIYRMGYYNNQGGRWMLSIPNITGDLQSMPVPQDKSNGGLIECNWNESYRLTVPTSWISGVYLAKLTESINGWQSYIIFVVRDDARAADVLMQCSVTTYQAYNGWGGRSIYACNSERKKDANGAYISLPGQSPPWELNDKVTKVSFNRPYYAAHRGYSWEGQHVTSYVTGSGHLFANFPFGSYEPAWEYNMIRWLEKEGHDVTYCTNIDVHRDPQLLLSRRAFISVGHDEYWTREMRVNAELARDQGVDLMFCCGNSVYRQSRLEADAQGNPYRTLVCHKPESASPVTDPLATKILNNLASDDDLYPYPNVTGEFCKESRYEVTVAWPEATLTGSTWTREGFYQEDFTVTGSSDWIFSGSTAVPDKILTNLAGYEVDGDMPSSRKYSPSNRRVLATSQRGGLVLAYAVDGGATVFSSGSIHWSWGLDDWQIPEFNLYQGRPGVTSETTAVVQKMTTNLLARAVRKTGAEAYLFHPNGAGGITQFGFAGGWRVRWRIIPGSFKSEGSKDAFFYDPTTGEGQFYTFLSNGSVQPFGPLYRGMRKTWRIVAGNFSDSTLTDLLFYDRVSGEVLFSKTDGNGNLLANTSTPNGPLSTGWRRMWQIIPGRFGGGTDQDDLLFYDPAHGEVRFYSTDGKGGLRKLTDPSTVAAPNTGWRRTWKIIPGAFGGTRGLTDLLFYDPVHGEAQFYEPDEVLGQLKPIGSMHPDWRKGWQIIPGKFNAASSLTDLLFYDAATGEGLFFSVAAQGRIEGIGPQNSGWRKTWQILALPSSGPALTDLLFYDSFATVP